MGQKRQRGDFVVEPGGDHAGVQNQHAAIAELVAEDRVRDFVAHAAAVGGEEGFAAGVGEQAAGGCLREVAGAEFVFVERGDRQRIAPPLTLTLLVSQPIS